MSRMTICPLCKGRGKTIAHHNTGPDSSGHYWADITCRTCSGMGRIKYAKAKQVSASLRNKRSNFDRLMKEISRRMHGKQ